MLIHGVKKAVGQIVGKAVGTVASKAAASYAGKAITSPAGKVVAGKAAGKIGNTVGNTAGRAIAGKAASKAAGKVAAKLVSKSLGIGFGVVLFALEIYWHNQNTKRDKPILRRNLMDYLAEVEYSILNEPETGIMSIIYEMQANVVSGLKTATQ